MIILKIKFNFPKEPLLFVDTLIATTRMENRIKVGVRVRPLSAKEISESSANTVITDEQGHIFIGNDNKKASFQFDWSFGSNSQQRELYDMMCKPLIDQFYEGYNTTFFACKFAETISITLTLKKTFQQMGKQERVKHTPWVLRVISKAV